MSTLRLISAAGLHDGKYDAGVDISMAPGSHTYWKIPGEAGVPPVFSFNGSENVRDATVQFPVPTRMTEEGLDAYGYAGQVVFPVIVTPVDASKPASLHVDVSYAICNRICLPGHGAAVLTLQPHGAGDASDLVAAALAQVPRPTPHADDLRIVRDKNASAPTWTLTWAGPTPLSDIFPDAPDGFYFSTKKTGPSTWALTAEQGVTAPKATSVPVTLVLAGEKDATETKQTFDIAPNGK